MVDSAFTDAGIAIGVIGEVAFGTWDSRIQTELRRRSNDKLGAAEKTAAELRNRAAELERITAWRRIPSEEKTCIAETLKPIASSIRLFFEYQNGDMEAFSYTSEIALTFEAANVKGAYPHTAKLWMQGALAGASISTTPEIDENAIVSAFKSGGVEFWVRPWDQLKMFPIPQTEPRPNVSINVYPKPPPDFPLAPMPEAKAPNAPPK